MGQVSLAGFSSLLPQASAATPSSSSTQAASNTAVTDSSSERTSSDTVSLGGSNTVSATYHAAVAQVAFVVKLQQVRAQLGDSQNGVQVSGQQLEFAFFGQVRSDELSFFSQKSAETANSLNGSQQESYLEASQRVAARFQMSFSFSGAALQGFSGTADALKNSGSAWDAFMALTSQALDQSDDIASQVFDLLNGFFKHTDTGDGNAFTKFINEVFGMMKDIGGQSTQTGQSEQTGQKSTNTSASTSTTQVQVDIQLSFSFEVTDTQGRLQQSDPITLDLDGDGIELSSYTDGTKFDITGSGKNVNTGFVTGGDAFLALDRNGNGTIDSGKELFGDQNGATNGYEELRKLDSNSDGIIDARDRDFGKLVLFTGKSENGKLQTLADAGITAISLGYRNTSSVASGGNLIGQIGSYIRSNGTKGLAADAILNYLV